MVEQKLLGNWKAGWAIDLHTTSSSMTRNGKFDNTRTEIGEALYKFKYQSDYNQLIYLSNQLINFMNTRMVTKYLDVIIPVPPSSLRPFQPVHELAVKLGEGLSKAVNSQYLLKIRSTSQLKSIVDLGEREKVLSGAFSLSNPILYKGKKVLLVDDLYRSGSTLKEITRILYEQGQVSNVYVVTLTKTRVNR